MRPARSLAFLAACSLFAGACSPGGGGTSSSDPPPIEVLAAFNLTGGMDWIDGPALNGYLLAADEVNAAGGIGGRPIDVIVVDGGSNEHILARRVGEALADHDILVIGGLTDGIYALAPRRGAVHPAAGGLVSFGPSSIALAVAPVGTDAGVPVVAIGSSLPDLPALTGDRFFGIAAGTHHKVSAIAAYAMGELGARRAVVLGQEDHDFTVELAHLFGEEWHRRDGEVVFEARYSPGLVDLPDAIAQVLAIDPQPDVVFVAGLPNDAGIILDEVRRAGLGQPLLSADWYASPFIAPYTGEGGDDLYFAVDLTLDQPGDALARFEHSYEAAYGEPPPYVFAALGYDAMRLITSALADAAELEPESVAVALAAQDSFPSLRGTISLERRGRPTGPLAILRTEDGQPRYVTGVEVAGG